MNRPLAQRARPGLLDARAKWRQAVARHEALLLGLAAFALFMIGIWHQPFINFETRFAVFAQEMLRNGPTLFPTTYGRPYPDYPVTSTLLIWLVSLPFGAVSKFTAALPTAAAAALIVALTYKLFAPYSRQWALLAVGFEFLTLTFDAEARSISVDQMVSAITLAAFYLTHKAYRQGGAVPLKPIAFLFVAGFLIRGPIGLVIPAGVVISHLLVTAGWREIARCAACSAGVLLACSAAFLAMAMLVYGTGFVADIIRMQAVNRFSEATPLPITYYFVSGFGNYALSYPIAVLAALTLALARWHGGTQGLSGERATFIVLLAAWVGIVLVGLSIPETKKIRYILPVVPALAGLASFALIDSEYRLVRLLRSVVNAVLVVLPLLAAVLVYTQRARLAAAGINVPLLIAGSSALFLLSIVLTTRTRLTQETRSLAACALAAASVYALQLFVVEPFDLYLHDTSGFVRHVEALLAQKPGKLAFYQENPDGLVIKYLVNATTDFTPLFLNSADEIRNNRTPLWLLIKDENLGTLRKAGIDGEVLISHENFAKAPFSAIFIAGRPSQ